MANSNKQFLFISFLRVSVLGFIEIVKGLGAKVLCESFDRKFWAVFFLEPYSESGSAGLGWAGLGWAGLDGLDRAGPGWAGLLGGLGWAGLGWAGAGAGLGWAGLGWAGLGCSGLGCWAGLCEQP